jgi:archaeal type IV pilus assembly protein PilA
MNFGKQIRKFRRQTRGISPVIATLLMIAIAVVASLVTYAWVMGYMNFTTNKTGLAIQIQSVAPIDNPAPAVDTATIYVQNVGDGVVDFANPCVYIDGVSYPVTTTRTGGLLSVDAGTTIDLNLASNPFVAGSHSYTIKVTSSDGTFSQIDKIFPP